jgi:serine/threonine-protein kinase
MLNPGTRLGPYEVVAKLGAGGMGEVYRARDTKLGREVAVKVLPVDLVADEDRVARFEREARALAALNHPNIATLFGMEHADGQHLLVMELVEGPTLAERIDGPMPIDQALPIASQIVLALEAAHEKGIIHRDLKPANIKVTDDGVVKVLDFGLAKAIQGDGSSGEDPSPSNSPTLTARATQMGMILGTAAYMAPEQAKGRPVDRRADIWAFGVVLYEMLTGRRAFEGDDVSDVMAAVLKLDVDWSALPPGTPAPIRALLRRCLEKDRKERTPDIANARFAIREVLSAPAAADAVPARSAPHEPIWRQPAVWIGAAVLTLVVGTATWWVAQPVPAAAPPVGRFTFAWPAGTSPANRTNRVLAISPPGTHVTFEANNQIWLRRLNDLEPTLLTPLETAARAPFFSPDGSEVGFVADGQVKRVALAGGTPVVVGGPVPLRPYGVSWGHDGFIYLGMAGAVSRLPATGGPPEAVITLEEGEVSDGPQLLPGGEWLLFSTKSATETWDQSRIVVESLETHERRVLTTGGHAARMTAAGQLMYVSGSTLFGQVFDPLTFTPRGGPVSLVDDVRTSRGAITGDAYYDISSRGDLVYVAGAASNEQSRLAWVDRDGGDSLLPFEPASFNTLRLSPDGRRIAAEELGADGGDIWLFNIDRPGGQRLTSDGRSRDPVWSPDGEWIYFGAPSAEGADDLDIWRKRADLSGDAEAVLARAERDVPWSISADGAWLAFTSLKEDRTVGVMPLSGQVEPTEYGPPASYASNPSISPDGRFIAYESSETGRTEVYVREVESGRKQLISSGGGMAATWSRKGDEVFFWAGDDMQVATVISLERLEFSAPRTLHSRPGHAYDYEVSADGQRFVHIVPATPSGAVAAPTVREIRVVLNWFQELDARVPVK